MIDPIVFTMTQKCRPDGGARIMGSHKSVGFILWGAMNICEFYGNLSNSCRYFKVDQSGVALLDKM